MSLNAMILTTLVVIQKLLDLRPMQLCLLLMLPC